MTGPSRLPCVPDSSSVKSHGPKEREAPLPTTRNKYRGQGLASENGPLGWKRQVLRRKQPENQITASYGLIPCLDYGKNASLASTIAISEWIVSDGINFG